MKSNSLPYKLAAIDLDGTLLDENKQISNANLLALQKLEQAGLRIVLASGRTHESIMNFQKQLGLTGPVVSSHGSLVKHSHKDEIISFSSLERESTKKAIEEGCKRNATIIYCQLDGAYINTQNEWTDLFQSRAGRKANFVSTFDTLHNENICKIIWMNDSDVLSRIQQALPIEFTNKYYVARGDAEHLEFLSRKVNKAFGLNSVANNFNIDKESIIAFGDADNDISMLQWAGLGVAMNHATKGAKAAAAIIAPPGPSDSNFAQAVELLFQG